jgi:hypothetical protein
MRAIFLRDFGLAFYFRSFYRRTLRVMPNDEPAALRPPPSAL